MSASSSILKRKTYTIENEQEYTKRRCSFSIKHKIDFTSNVDGNNEEINEEINKEINKEINEEINEESNKESNKETNK
ncbi:428_t:CDS:2 [Racocetra fulgida]|uniref:428_t:CDS:1 n=1 Tax=Racocetra fulgida TaxID=60492 RepID=A0A9N9B4R1_9GLOM|nr:428_t:CDS:2 [Racocetra fulgida]